MSIADYEATLEYIPPPSVPVDFDRHLKQIVGVNPHTNGPWLRFVWGMDRLEFCDGEWIRRYPDADGKYAGNPFWVLEGWQSPDVFDRNEWEIKAGILGPFPVNGEWDYIETVRTPDYKFINLGPKALQMAREWRHWKSKPKTRAIDDLAERRRRLASLGDERFAAKRQEILDTMMENIIAAEEKTNPVFSLPGSRGEFERSEGGLVVPKIWN